MTKVETWTGHTQTHGFNAEVSKDTATGQFIADIAIHSPNLPQQYAGGSAQPPKFEESITLTDKDIDKLRERVTFQANLKPQRRQRASIETTCPGSGGSGTTTPR